MRSTIVKTLAATGLVAATMLPAGAAHAAATPECTAGDLVVTYHSTDAGAGHRYGKITLKNTSDAACTTGGYGGLSYVGHGNGTQIGAAADRTPGKVRTIVLQPGDKAKSLVDETVAQNYPRKTCKPTAVDGFRVYVPNETHSVFVAHETTGCAKGGVHLIAHQPFHAA